ncbi:sugar ABC transporter substrate-binding protein [Streptomyces endophyticus]|uniref:Sugar ABC transporter substrate-binding protein n=1 Tax=Streptomyces endophyticus TaxID=714166 RepID=A0ABU6F698_9ACTN|nr:sugar ABC transporter substrate-binding protein [Streptomyces endophyticus]MEB8339547.1 sugar ABC transporter substrate-binding protein [Streptomyces endophyticus]
MNRRVIAATGTALALGLTATACGGGGSEADGGTDGKGKTLSVWIMEGTNPDAKPFFKEAAAAFEKKTGAKIKVEYQQWASAQRKFTTAIEGGADQVPDVAEVGTTWVPGFADKGALVDVSKEVDEAGLTDDLVPALKDAGTLGGKQYGMPWYAGVRSVVYRKDIFEKHKIKPPTNWEELGSAAKTLKKEEPKMLAFPVAGGAEMFATPFIWGAGGELAVKKGGKWKSGINSKKSVEGITAYTDLALKDKVSPAKVNTWTEKEVGDAWNKGEVAMSFSGNWTPKAFTAANPDLKGKLGAIPIPGKDGGMSPSFLGGSYLSAFKTDKQALSWEFIKLLTTGKFAKKWAEQSSYLPPTNTDLDKMPDKDNALVKPFVKQFKDGGASVPKAKSYTEIQATQVIPKMVQSILAGKSTPQQAADKAAKEMDAIFAQSE